MAGKQWSLGRCLHFFGLAVVFDTVGLGMLLTGVFLDLAFYDMLVYLGSSTIFLSLLWWASWYTGNIELPSEVALKDSCMPSACVVEALRQSASHRLSVSIQNISANWLMQPRRRRRTLRKEAFLTMPVSVHVEEQLGKKSRDKDGEEGVKGSDASQDFGKEDLGPKPEGDKNSEIVGSPVSDAQPPSIEQLPPTHPEWPVLPLHQPVPSVPSILQTSKSLIVAPSISATHPVAICTSESRPVVSLASNSQPAVPMASQSHLQVPAVSLSQPLVLVTSQDSLQNLPRASQTQPPPPSSISVTQSLATQVHVGQSLSAQSFPIVDPQASQAVEDLHALLQMQQAIPSTSVVQESSLSQFSSVLKVPEMPVAQAVEAPRLLPSQKPCQEPSALATTSSASEASASATDTQRSVSTVNVPASVAAKKSHPLY
nr:cytadherence high molecular weight protein 1-like [Saimiri boliviensis boliviensis]XP_010337709.2 cytadherence high molecular weight protein 1-like [Saimiri boliviensis boliviensis]XP_039334119.1 cytadherence high molecular weight protein 1-like [Saimiri boliviensis boliviensis]